MLRWYLFGTPQATTCSHASRILHSLALIYRLCWCLFLRFLNFCGPNAMAQLPAFKLQAHLYSAPSCGHEQRVLPASVALGWEMYQHDI